MKGYNKRQWITGIVAIVAIAVCGMKIRYTLQNSPAAIQRRRMRMAWQARPPYGQQNPIGTPDQPVSSRPDDGKVLEWQILAKPILVPHDYPATGGIYASVYRPQRIEGRGVTKPIEVIPAIEARVEVTLIAEMNRKPAIWPGIAALEFSRASSRDGPFAPCSKMTRAELDAVQIIPITGYNSKRTRFTYRVFAIDRNVTPGQKLYYRARLTNAAGKILAESGHCSAVAIQPPVAEIDVDRGGSATITWPDLATSISQNLSEPAFSVSLTSPGIIVSYDPLFTPQTILARQTTRAGNFRIPISVEETSQEQKQIVFALTGAMSTEQWNSAGGSVVRQQPVGVCLCFAPKIDKKRASSPTCTSIYPVLTPAYGQLGTNSDTYTIQPRPSRDCQIADILRQLEGEDEAKSILVDLQQHGRLQNSWRIASGKGARVNYTIRGRAGSGEIECHTSLLSPPRINGLRTLPDDGHVRLVWEPVHWNPVDWAVGPEIAILRGLRAKADLSHAAITSVAPMDIVARCPADSCTWSDTSVKNGNAYIYALRLEGITRATAFSSASGAYEVLLPVCFRGGQKCINRYPASLAVPGPVGPLRIGITSLASNKDTLLLDQAEKQLVTAFGEQPWVQLIERSQADKLLDEQSLGNLSDQHDKDDERAEDTPETTDLILRCQTRWWGGRQYLDVWLIDYRNQWRERIAALPTDDISWDQFMAAVFAGVETAYPGCRKRRGTASEPTELVPCAIAVLGFSPISPVAGADIPAKSIDDLIELALTEHGQWLPVERTHLQETLTELGISDMNDSASLLQLGKLLKAKLVLTGHYGTQAGETSLVARPLDVITGIQLGTVEVKGPTGELAKIAGDLVARLTELRPAGNGTADVKLLRQMEAQITGVAPDRLAGSKRALFVDPDSMRALETMAQEYENSGKLEQAANAFQQAILVSVKKGEAPRWLYESADRCLRKLNKTEERITLWEHAVEQEAKGNQRTYSAVWLAEAYCDANQLDKAREIFGKYAPDRQDNKTNSLREKLGLVSAPIKSYLDAEWFVHASVNRPWFNRRALGPNYAALIRLLDTAGMEDRVIALKRIASRLSEDRPFQALRAVRELKALGKADAQIISMEVKSTARIGDDAACNAALADLLAHREETEQCIRAFAAVAASLYRYEKHRKTAERIAGETLKIDVDTEAAMIQKEILKRLLSGKRQSRSSENDGKAGDLSGDAVKKYIAEGGGRNLDGDVCVLTEWGTLARLRLPSLSVVWKTQLGPHTPFPRKAKDDEDRPYVLGRLPHTMWITDDLIIATNPPHGVVFAIEAATGRTRWRYTAWTGISPPVVRADLGWVSIANGFGNLLMLSLEDGHLIRKIRGPEKLESEFCERLPDLRADLVRKDDGMLHQTEWVQFLLCNGFYSERNFWSYRHGGRFRRNLMIGTHRFNVSDFSVRLNTNDNDITGVSGKTERILDRSRSEDIRMWSIATSDAGPEALQMVPALRTVAQDETEDAKVRHSALRHLARISPDAAMPVIESFLADKDDSFRESAIHILKNNITRTGAAGKPGMRTEVSDNVVNRLTQLSKSDDRDVRQAAMVALANCLGREAHPLVRKILEDETNEDRMPIAMKLAQDGDHSVLPILKGAFHRDRPVEKQVGILKALARLGDAEARDTLMGMIKTEGDLKLAREATQKGGNGYARSHVEAVLQLIREVVPDPSYVPFLIEMLPLFNGDIARSVGRTLQVIDSPDVVPFLIGLLPDSDLDGRPGIPSRESAKTNWVSPALEQITGHGWGNNRTRWEQWYASRTVTSDSVPAQK